MNTPLPASGSRPMRGLRRFRGFAPGLVLAAAGACSVGALSGVSGAATNPATTGSAVQLQEGVGATTCLSMGSPEAPGDGIACDRIDDLGGASDQAPGDAPTATTITLTNVGTIGTSSAAVQAGVCSAAAARDDGGYAGTDLAGFCGRVDVTIANATPGAHYRCLFPVRTTAICPAPDADGTLATLSGSRLTGPGMSALAAGGTATYVITVGPDPSQTNADQGLTATLPLTWTISQ
ncbi:MAG TPA: hypothetical protein VME70_00150 [Mycobacteriales bacterium]|nr:hypothetical protein [Mycobacteriales bacterium]